MFEKEPPESRIIDELCFPDITDKLIDRLGLSRNDSMRSSTKRAASTRGRLRLLTAVESHHALAEKLLTLLHYYRDWYDNPNVLPRKCRESLGVRPAWRANRPSPRPASLVSAEIATGARKRP